MDPIGFEEWTYAGNVKRLRFVVRRQRGYVRRKGLAKPRVYHKKGELVSWEPAYYFTIYIENWHGSGIARKRGEWSTTVQASLTTENPINDEVYEAIVSSVGGISKWIRDELRLHNPRGPITRGSTPNEERKRSDLSEDAGFVRWSIQDKLVATVFVGLRQEESFSVDDVLDEVERRVKLDIVGGTVSARVAR